MLLSSVLGSVLRQFNSIHSCFKASGSFRSQGGPITVNSFSGDTLVCLAAGGYALICLSMVPTEEPWPRSLIADKIQLLILKGREHARKRPRSEETEQVILQDELSPDDDLASHQFFPYPIDFKETFFILAQAIKVVLSDKVVVCEGVYNVRENSIRIDALDAEFCFWLSIKAKTKQNQKFGLRTKMVHWSNDFFNHKQISILLYSLKLVSSP